MIFLSTLLLSLFITLALVPIFRSLALQMGNGLDIPNARKVHDRPVPKTGGIAMALGSLLPLLLLAGGSRFTSAVLVGAAIIVFGGMLDDLRDLSWKTKFGGQAIAALVVILWGGVRIDFLGELLPEGVFLPPALSMPLTLLIVVGVTNAINLSDGLDGLAGGTSLIIFICICYLAFSVSEHLNSRFIALLSMAMIGAIFGFLRYNTFPAKVFMGDTGSQLLGFLAVTLTLELTQGTDTPISPLVPLLLLGFPVLDTLTVMAARIARGRSPFVADKNHFHHKLMRLGFHHTEAVMVIYGITVVMVTIGFLLRFHSEWTILTVYGLFSATLIGGFARIERSGWQLKREGFLDVQIKGRLQAMRDRGIHIRVVFGAARYLLPALLLFGTCVPAAVPFYFSLVCLAMIVLAGAAAVFLRSRLADALRVTFYLALPFLLRIGQVDPAGWMTPLTWRAYSIAFAVLAVCTVLTLKFTRRQKGFRATPTDFLILAIAMVVPNLPDPLIQSYQMAFLATSMIVMYFSFEVLIGELRGRVFPLAGWVTVSLAVLTARGLI